MNDLSPTAQVILAHLRTVSSATMPRLRLVTKQGTQPTKDAAHELCRAGLVVSEWSGVRFRLRDSVRAQERAQA